MTEHALPLTAAAADGDDEVARLIASMRSAVAAAPEIYRPGEFWDGLIETNLEMLRSSGIANFKRTVSNNYYNWIVTSLRDPQVRNALVAWLRTPSLTPLRTRLDEPMTGLRTLDRGDAYELSGQKALRYRLFVGALWDLAGRDDPDRLTERLQEPIAGNPLRIRLGDRFISQDLANSIIEYGFAARSGVARDGARVAELGAGYGRLAFVHASAGRPIYCIFDIPPALAIAQWYLTEVLGRERIVAFDPEMDFASVQARLVPGVVAFFTPEQLERFPDGWFDLTQTISTLPEMPLAQAAHYLRLLTDKSRRALFLKQWRGWRNDPDGVELREQDYAVPAGWYTRVRRVDPVQPQFFNQLWWRADAEAVR